MNLTDFIWKQFPPYFGDNDTNKDGTGKGTFQRFLSVFGIELQEEVVSKLDNLINEKDPNTSSDVFLTEIAFALGRPIDVLGDTNLYRTLLTQIISIYKIKGTKKSYELLFALYGLEIDLVEHFPEENIYDGDLIYDDDSLDSTLYDITACEVGCVDYSITYRNIEGFNNAPLTEDQEAALRAMISEFIEPIDSHLRDLTFEEEPEPELSLLNSTSQNIEYLINGSPTETLPVGDSIIINPGDILALKMVAPPEPGYTYVLVYTLIGDEENFIPLNSLTDGTPAIDGVERAFQIPSDNIGALLILGTIN